MLPENEDRLEKAFSAALSVPTARRVDFICELCGDDSAFRAELQDLLAHDVDNFLERPALELEVVRESLLASAISTGRRAGAYSVLEKLGSGGMAVVYRGERADGAFHKQVAIKVFNRFYSAGADESRFRREMKILAQLQSPYIANVIDAGTQDDHLYFVMDFVDGQHIDAYCRLHQLSVPARLRLFRKVCEGVILAHNNQIIHRDLKPSNILVDTSGTPKIIDFGIAKRLDLDPAEPATTPGLEVMTLFYASPEQLSADPDLAAQPSSDIYSLGVILFELLTGVRPIEPPPSVPPVELPRYLLETEPQTPSRINRALPADLDLILLKALRKDRTERFQSVEQFARYISLYLNDRPLPERAPGLLYKSRKFLKRNWAAVSVAALLLLTLLGGLYTTQRQARIAQRRFEDVRQLASSFLFEFDGSIANLSGATQSRRLVVAKGLEYLDKLARDAGDDDALKEEIAAGYERLAAIQGNVYGSNLGEYQQAAASYEHALALRKDLAQRDPDSASRLRGLGNSYLQLADGWFNSGNTKSAVGYYTEGVKILEKLSANGDSSKSTQTGLQRGYSRLCNYLLSTGDHAGALDNCGKSIRLTTSLLSANPSDRSLRAALAAAYGQQANALRLDKRPQEAIPRLQSAAAEFEALHALDPDNNNYVRNIAGVYSVLGASQKALNDLPAASKSFEKSIQAVRLMISKDPSDARPKTTLAVSLLRLAEVLRQSGQNASARQAAAEGLRIFRAFADRPQATPEDLNTYASFLNEMAIEELKNPQEALSYSLRAVAAVKEPSLVLLSTLSDSFSNAGRLREALQAGKQALATGAPKPGTPEAGLRAEMESKVRKLEASLATASR